MNQTLTLEERIVSELTANFTDLLTRDSAELELPELELSSNTDRDLELETDSIQLASADLFSDSEVESPLYSSMAISEDNEAEPVVSPEPMDELIAEAPLTNTITVGNEGGTQFTFNFAEDTPQEVIDGVAQAGENWASVLKDDVDLTIDFTFAPIDAAGGVLGISMPNFIPYQYSTVNSALATDITSLDDRTAVANLPQGENVNYLVNNTAENNGSDTPYLDSNSGLNNSNISLTSANAKALNIGLEDLAAQSGLSVEEYTAQISAIYGTEIDPNAPDATPIFNSNVNWDFDPSDGIATDAFDFVGVVTHELGHALGFFSNAEILDVTSVLSIGEIAESLGLEDSDLVAVLDAVKSDQFISENEYLPTTLDLYRFSSESFEQGARDFTTNNIEGKYFSIDGGQTEIAPLAEGLTGELNTDGLSHWQEGLNIGLMDPAFAPGELGEISETDLLALDVVGWNVA